MDAAEVGAYWLLLCVAWENERHGYLPDHDDNLRRWSRLSREQWAQSRELILSKFPVVEAGFRANPRMVGEAEKARLFAEKQSDNGKKGGRPKKNPSLSNENPSLRKVKPKRKLPLPLPSPVPKRTQSELEVDCESYQNQWNENCGKLAKVTRLTDTRRAKIHARAAEGLTPAVFVELAKVCLATPFLAGEKGDWKANFDWLLANDTHWLKVREGSYGPPVLKLVAVPPREASDLYNSAEYQPRKVVNQ